MSYLVVGGLAVLAISILVVVGPRLFRPRLDWPDDGIPIVPGSPEEALDRVLAALAAGDLETAAGSITDRYGVSAAEVAKTLADGLRQVGQLRRWLIVATLPGDPVTCTVYASFSRAGDVAMTAEVYADPEGWRLGNLRASTADWQPPDWEGAATARVRIVAWPGCRADLDALLARAEEGYDQALGPIRAGAPEFAGFPAQVSVYIYNSQENFGAGSGTRVQSWSVGAFAGGAVHLVSPSGVAGRDLDLYQIYVHELNHGLFQQYAWERAGRLPPLPAWLLEGTAGLAAGQLDAGARKALMTDAAKGPLPALDELAEGFATNAITYRYQYAYSLAEYLVHEYGPDVLARLVDALCDGLRPGEAVRQVTGDTQAKVESGWRAWLSRGSTW